MGAGGPAVQTEPQTAGEGHLGARTHWEGRNMDAPGPWPPLPPPPAEGHCDGSLVLLFLKTKCQWRRDCPTPEREVGGQKRGRRARSPRPPGWGWCPAPARLAQRVAMTLGSPFPHSTRSLSFPLPSGSSFECSNISCCRWKAAQTFDLGSSVPPAPSRTPTLRPRARSLSPQ